MVQIRLKLRLKPIRLHLFVRISNHRRRKFSHNLSLETYCWCIPCGFSCTDTQHSIWRVFFWYFGTQFVPPHKLFSVGSCWSISPYPALGPQVLSQLDGDFILHTVLNHFLFVHRPTGDCQQATFQQGLRWAWRQSRRGALCFPEWVSTFTYPRVGLCEHWGSETIVWASHRLCAFYLLFVCVSFIFLLVNLTYNLTGHRGVLPERLGVYIPAMFFLVFWPPFLSLYGKAKVQDFLALTTFK